MTGHALIPRVILAALAALSACSDSQEPSAALRIAGGEPEQGRALIQSYGCGTCHTISGVRGARGRVGPELNDYAQQHLLAGFLPNTSQNLIAWLVDPVALKPRTGMPAQGLTETEARHIASYLYTLGDSKVRVYPPDPPLPLRGQEETTVDLPEPPPVPLETQPRTRRAVPDRAAPM
ncbi:c-type cytochrome [Microvirga sp. 3-52]|uniref:c-type cytochrome n=1 Tax=Microvirga sp. 3-52 TaxID=2792425 RepID=UPI001AC56BEA|nr:c-type cytochrome [Microvirga sp. 3-52]MBO1903412.1 c-type cytochrome [Microvirga sp. 3-52]MBS7450989.1 c-type cytochrome [Microvirga sp. 3-52]